MLDFFYLTAKNAACRIRSGSEIVMSKLEIFLAFARSSYLIIFEGSSPLCWFERKPISWCC